MCPLFVISKYSFDVLQYFSHCIMVRTGFSLPRDFKSRSRPLYTSSSTYTPVKSDSSFRPHAGLSGAFGHGGAIGTASVGASYHGDNHSIHSSVSRSGSTFNNKGSNEYKFRLQANL